jgi:hypothetical protein
VSRPSTGTADKSDAASATKRGRLSRVIVGLYLRLCYGVNVCLEALSKSATVGVNKGVRDRDGGAANRRGESRRTRTRRSASWQAEYGLIKTRVFARPAQMKRTQGAGRTRTRTSRNFDLENLKTHGKGEEQASSQLGAFIETSDFRQTWLRLVS